MTQYSAQQLVEKALAASTADGCVVYVVESTEVSGPPTASIELQNSVVVAW